MTNTKLHSILSPNNFSTISINSLYHKDTEKADLSLIVCFLYNIYENRLLIDIISKALLDMNGQIDLFV